MDGSHFDALTRILTAPLSRRVTLGGLAAGLLVALGLALEETTVLAKKKNKGKGNNNNKKNNKNKKKKKNNCRGFRPVPCGKNCCSLAETCRNGTCIDHCQDGVLNLGETGVDCGGTCRDVRKCVLGDFCNEDADCVNNVCVSTICVFCRIDSDCDQFGPPNLRCIDNVCFECAQDADCPVERKFCVGGPECPNNAPCACRECGQDSHCPRPGQSAAQKFCVEGASALGECPANQPCVCRQCRDDVDCAAGQTCDELGLCEGDPECTPLEDGCGFPGFTVCCDGGQCHDTTSGPACRPANCLPDGSSCELGNPLSCCKRRCFQEPDDPAPKCQ